MKKKVLPFNVVMMILAIAVSSFAQGTVKSAAATIRDADLEKDAMHNLEVARHYFKQKKAYLAALQRCEEVIAGNPTFARIDEILFIAGESSLRLSEGKGKQSVKVAAAKLRDDARDYLGQLVNDYPQSPFREQAEAELKNLGPKPTTNKP
ncbi:MAG: Outer rane lipoprotein [Blastocatellia bacterium]|jgi:outer membrane protein assembly factor BamD (BamD/ComL family)|nr:Outer rane lipoprotein [Blastocatellia bacterium]